MMIGDFPINLYSLEKTSKNEVADFGNVLLCRRGIAKKRQRYESEIGIAIFGLSPPLYKKVLLDLPKPSKNF